LQHVGPVAKLEIIDLAIHAPAAAGPAARPRGAALADEGVPAVGVDDADVLRGVHRPRAGVAAAVVHERLEGSRVKNVVVTEVDDEIAADPAAAKALVEAPRRHRPGAAGLGRLVRADQPDTPVGPPGEALLVAGGV